MEGVVGHNLAEGVDHIPAVVVGRIPAGVAAHNPARNPAEEAVGHMAADRIPGWVEDVIADRIHQGRHTVQEAVPHTDLAVHHVGDLVHLGCRMKNR